MEKHIKDFHNNCTDCKDCNFKRGLKNYDEKKIKSMENIIINKTEINFYRNKMIDLKNLKNYLDPMLI